MSDKGAPAWFSLADYDYCKELTDIQWAHAAIRRNDLARYINSGKTMAYSNQSVEDYMEWCRQDRNFAMNTMFNRLVDSDHPFPSLYGRTVTPVSVEELVSQWFSARELDEIKEYAAPLMENDIGHLPPPGTTEFNNLFLTPYHLLARNSESSDASVLPVLCQISLDTPLDKLMVDFKELVIEYREIMKVEGGSKSIAPLKMSRWCEYQVLPYLDLTLWAKYYDEKLTQHQLAGFSYPNEHEVDITARLRNRKKPYADELISDGFVRKLTNQAVFPAAI